MNKKSFKFLQMRLYIDMQKRGKKIQNKNA